MFAPAVSGIQSVQPDLLCSQNRFPQHLDTPNTVDVASSAQASIPQDFDLALDDYQHQGAAGQQNDQDDFNFANDILDGSFLASSGQHSMPLVTPQMPDISGLDLPGSLMSRLGASGHTEASNYQHSGANQLRTGPPAVEPDLEAAAPVSANDISANEQESANQIHWNVANNQSVQGEAESNSLLQRAVEEKESIQQDLERQQTENARLAEDLARAEALAESARQNLEKVQSSHREQLEGLRCAGHEALTVVVEEYRASLAAAVQAQAESCQRSLARSVREETEHLRALLVEQKETFDKLQESERQRNTELLKEAIADMKEKTNEEMHKLLAEEKVKFEHSIQEVVKVEQLKAEQKLTEVVKAERERSDKCLEQEQVKFSAKMAELAQEHKKALELALQEQQNKYKEEHGVSLIEERSRGREAVQEVTRAARDDLIRSLQQHRQDDRAMQRRQLASLDVFLESARHQLALLIDTSHDVDNSEADKHGCANNEPSS
ncbi:coiled-coil domain-containing protein 91-like isoform X2 [Dreissena polymorpha]|nr:coiled-coil domain-containing protein 91-like isoform X2 [Dreissena polymorpha]